MLLGFLLVSAHAADSVESVLSPGPVIEGHVKLEGDCKNCHVRFKKSAQQGLCMDCHEDVGKDVARHMGFHGRLKKGEQDCRRCHTEHKGRHVDITGLDPDRFDHKLTDFPLRDGHTASKIKCVDCHRKGKKYRDAPSDCVACHKKDDKHKGSLGPACADCHKETKWKDTKFDHSKTKFPLRGKHTDVQCRDCHKDPKFKGAPTACVACHKKDDEHKGRFGKRCDSCHGERDWKTIRFDHDRDTKYKLTGKHRTTKCEDCHAGILYQEKLKTTCIACHKKDDEHKGRYGEKCDGCHVTRDWKAVTFDHDRNTKYPLRGKHAKTKCDSCHTGHLYKQKLSTVCFACHEKDDKHKGQEGKKCDSCHNEQNWKVGKFDHGLTRFPLFGKHVKVECKECHKTPQFKDARSDCVGCHDKDDTHKRKLGTRCETCHNAADWKRWDFDHNKRTKFMLDGAHSRLDCLACHTRPMTGKLTAPATCAGCHTGDDIHDGRFGRQCDRCHYTDNWGRIKPGMGMGFGGR